MKSEAPIEEPRQEHPRVALVLGGGAARGLAHIGVLEVLEREAIKPYCIVGTSMGGLVGALSAAGLDARSIADIARGFRFPRWFLPGTMLDWNSLFAPALPALSGTFEELEIPLAVTSVDLEAGALVVLHTGPVLPAVQATCTVPGILPPVHLEGRWLVDGGLMNVLPVDVAWMSDSDVVVAVKAGGMTDRRIPQLDWRINAFFSRLGRVLPNPASAKVTIELLLRAVEIMLDRQTTLAVAMTGPELMIEPDVGDIALRDFHRLEDAMAAGRRAAEAALPELERLLQSTPPAPATGERTLNLRFDPVCAMVINPSRARARLIWGNKTYYFCSRNCRDRFERDPDAYLGRPRLELGGAKHRPS